MLSSTILYYTDVCITIFEISYLDYSSIPAHASMYCTIIRDGCAVLSTSEIMQVQCEALRDRSTTVGPILFLVRRTRRTARTRRGADDSYDVPRFDLLRKTLVFRVPVPV